MPVTGDTDHYDTDYITTCVECGHLHWNSTLQIYIPCPLDECGCPMDDTNA